MIKSFPLALGFAAMLAGAVQAQTATPSTASPPTGAPTISSPTGTTVPGNNATVAAPATSAAPAAITTTAAPSRTTEAPVAGANSFTEGQARARIEERGYAQVVDLKKDDKGVWRGTGMKDGKSSAVALDYQGNIVAQ